MEEEENEMQEDEAEGLITQYYSQPKNVCAFAFFFLINRSLQLNLSCHIESLGHYTRLAYS